MEIEINLPKSLRNIVSPEITGRSLIRFGLYVDRFAQDAKKDYENLRKNKDSIVEQAKKRCAEIRLEEDLKIDQPAFEKGSFGIVIKNLIFSSLKKILRDCKDSLSMERLQKEMFPIEGLTEEEMAFLQEVTVIPSPSGKTLELEEFLEPQLFANILNELVSSVLEEYFLCLAIEHGKHKQLLFENFVSGYNYFITSTVSLLLDYKIGTQRVIKDAVEDIQNTGGPIGFAARDYLGYTVLLDMRRRAPYQEDEVKAKMYQARLEMFYITASLEGAEVLAKLNEAFDQATEELTDCSWSDLVNYPEWEEFDFQVEPKLFVALVERLFISKIGQDKEKEMWALMDEAIISARNSMLGKSRREK